MRLFGEGAFFLHGEVGTGCVKNIENKEERI